MRHLYQPMVIQELITAGGKAAVRQLALSLLAQDAAKFVNSKTESRKCPGAVELDPADPEKYCSLMDFYAGASDDRILKILKTVKEHFPWAKCMKDIDRILNQPEWLWK